MDKQAAAARARGDLEEGSPPPLALGLVGFLDKKELDGKGRYKV